MDSSCTRAHKHTGAESNVAASGSRGGPKITLEMSVATPLLPQADCRRRKEAIRVLLLMQKDGAVVPSINGLLPLPLTEVVYGDDCVV